MDRDEIINKRVRRIAEDHSCTVDDVHQALDAHPIEIDRDKYLKRTLALQLLQLDALEVAFGDKAFVDHDVAAGTLLVKIAERRSSLLGLNAPLGHAVAVVQHEPPAAQTSTERLRAAIDRIQGRLPKPDEPDDPKPPSQPH